MSECRCHLYVTLRDAKNRNAWLEALRDNEPTDEDSFEPFEALLDEEPDVARCDADGDRGLSLELVTHGRSPVETLFDEMRALFGGAVESMLCSMHDVATDEYVLLRLQGSTLETGIVAPGDEGHDEIARAKDVRAIVDALVADGAIRLDAFSALVEDWDASS